MATNLYRIDHDKRRTGGNVQNCFNFHTLPDRTEVWRMYRPGKLRNNDKPVA